MKTNHICSNNDDAKCMYHMQKTKQTWSLLGETKAEGNGHTQRPRQRIRGVNLDCVCLSANRSISLHWASRLGEYICFSYAHPNGYFISARDALSIISCTHKVVKA
jgi:hypothetical protein